MTTGGHGKHRGVHQRFDYIDAFSFPNKKQHMNTNLMHKVN